MKGKKNEQNGEAVIYLLGSVDAYGQVSERHPPLEQNDKAAYEWSYKYLDTSSNNQPVRLRPEYLLFKYVSFRRQFSARNFTSLAYHKL